LLRFFGIQNDWFHHLRSPNKPGNSRFPDKATGVPLQISLLLGIKNTIKSNELQIKVLGRVAEYISGGRFQTLKHIFSYTFRGVESIKKYKGGVF
jgi:hypothetical protein